jgi:hypothetical protein
VGDTKGRRKIAWAIVSGFTSIVIVLVIIHWFFPQLVAKHTPIDGPVAIFSVVMAIVVLAIEHADFKRTKRFSISTGLYTLFMTVFALYYAGRAVAEHEIYTVKTTYDFTVKDGPPLVGKILRASSSGFIIFSDERVMFLPQGEIKQVKATDVLKD